MWGYERLLQRVVADTNLDLLHFSLHPLSGGRLAVEFALVLLHAVGDLGRRRDHSTAGLAAARAARTLSWRATAAGGWLAGALVAIRAGVRAPGRAVPVGPMWIALLVSAACALALARVERTHAPHLADRAARRLLPRAADARGGDVSVAAGTRDRSQGAADRDDVRSAGGEPARRPAAPAAAGGRADRRDSVARRAGPPRRLDAGRPIRRVRSPSGRAPISRPTA